MERWCGEGGVSVSGEMVWGGDVSGKDALSASSNARYISAQLGGSCL